MRAYLLSQIRSDHVIFCSHLKTIEFRSRQLFKHYYFSSGELFSEWHYAKHERYV